jgi:predicted transcriptional regulator
MSNDYYWDDVNDYYWDDVVEKVKELRDQGYTVLQIEEETGFDYEDVLWAVAKLETMGFIGGADEI